MHCFVQIKVCNVAYIYIQSPEQKVPNGIGRIMLLRYLFLFFAFHLTWEIPLKLKSILKVKSGKEGSTNFTTFNNPRSKSV